VPHGGEIPFVFGFGALTPYAPARDLAVKEMVQAYWTNFARTGDPNGAGLPAWPRYDGPAPPTLVIDDTTAAVPDYRKAETDVALRLWSARAGLPVP
jgi:para-nitrobenzyl esterase